MTLKADKTHDAPEVDQLLERLGGSAIPYYAIFPAASPDQPIVFDGLVSKSKVLSELKKAISLSNVAATASTASQKR